MAQLDADDLEQLADLVADRLKALPGGVIAAQGQSVEPVTMNAQQLAEMLMRAAGPRGSASTALPRESPTVPFGPGVPAPPYGLDPRFPDTDRPPPRLYEYPVGWNLPGAGRREVPFSVLRIFAEQVSVVRRCIEIRSNRLCSVDWTIGIRSTVVEAEAERSGQSRTDVRREMTKALQPEIDRLRTFWEMPDRIKRLTFSDWQALLLEEHFVHDGLSIYPHLNLGRELHSFEILDGSTIKPLLSYRGTTPQPPEPAFQQILYGFPRGEFTLNEDDDRLGAKRLYAPGGSAPSDVLIYRPFKRRVQTPYGYSPTEMALTEGDLWLKRLDWIRSTYTDGSSSRGYLMPKADTDWDIEQIRQFTSWINAELAGQTALRHQLRSLPPGWGVEFPQDFAERYEPTFDEHLVKLLCWPYGVMPTELGITPKSGLGGSGHQAGEAKSAERNADRPYVTKLVDLYNELSTSFLKMDPALTFVFDLEDDEDDASKADAAAKRIGSGLSTLNRELADSGEPVYDFDEANEPFVLTPTGPVFLRGMLERAQEQHEAAIAPKPAPVIVGAPGAPGVPAAEPAAEPAKGGSKTSTAAADEGKAFVRFAERRAERGQRWRDFRFRTVDADTAKTLNRHGRTGRLDLVKALLADVTKTAAEPAAYARNRSAIIGHYRAKLGPAIAKGFDVRSIAERWTAEHGGTTPAAFVGTVHVDTDDAVDTLKSLYGDSYAAGVSGGLKMLTKALMPDLVKAEGSGSDLELSDDEADFDWTDWEPGYGDAALEAWGDAGGRGLAQMLDDAGIAIKSIDDTNLDLLAELLGQSLEEGWSADQLAEAITELLTNPDRAEMIARTETARAMTVATRDTYDEHGIEKVEWLLSPGACELCEENEAAGAIPLDESFPNGDVPVHPNCLCAIAPVIETESDQ